MKIVAKEPTLRIRIVAGPEGLSFSCALCGQHGVTGGVDGFAVDPDSGACIGWLCTDCRFADEEELRDRLWTRAGGLQGLADYLKARAAGRIETASEEDIRTAEMRTNPLGL